MKPWTIACLAAVTLLAACGSDSNSGNSAGAGAGGAGSGYGAGGPGGAGGVGRAAPGTQEDLVQTAGDRIFFATDQSTLSDEARQILDRQAAWLQQYPRVNIWVAGNCDERGTEEYNLGLGQRRANTDSSYLVAHGIAQTRIQTISYGKNKPIDPNSTPEAWAQNRNAITSVR